MSKGMIEIKLVKRDANGNKIHGQFETIGQTNLYGWAAERAESYIARGQNGEQRKKAVEKFYGNDNEE